MGAPAGGKGGSTGFSGMGQQQSPAGGGKGGAMPHGQQAAGTPNMNNNWGGNSNYYGGFQGAGNVYDQASAGLGGAMNSAFQELQYGLPGGQGGGAGGGSSQWGSGPTLGAGAGGRVSNAAMNAWNPQQMQAGGYASQSLANTDLGQYMNPWETNVIDQNMADMNRARAMEQMQTGAKAGSAGAFGGDRHGLMEAENNRNFYDRAGAMSGQLRSQGFQNAQNAALGDIGNQNQASQFNIGQDAQAQMQNIASDQWKRGQMNSNDQLNANLANQYAMNMNNNASSGFATRMNAQNQQAQHRLNAANQLANMANLGFGMGNTTNQNMLNAGNQQQQHSQNIINAGKQNWGGYTGAPGQSLDYLNAGLGGSQHGQTTTGSSSPGLFDWAGLGAGMFNFGFGK